MLRVWQVLLLFTAYSPFSDYADVVPNGGQMQQEDHQPENLPITSARGPSVIQIPGPGA